MAIQHIQYNTVTLGYTGLHNTTHSYNNTTHSYTRATQYHTQLLLCYTVTHITTHYTQLHEKLGELGKRAVTRFGLAFVYTRVRFYNTLITARLQPSLPLALLATHKLHNSRRGRCMGIVWIGWGEIKKLKLEKLGRVWCIEREGRIGRV